MQNRNEFPARERPLPFETFKGYVLRLAYDNGRGTFKEITSIIGYKLKAESFLVGSKDYDAFTDILAPWLRMTGEELRRYFSPLNPIWLTGERCIENITFDAPRVCTACIKEEKHPFLKEQWLPAYHTHCEKHNAPLLDSCPACHHEFTWHSDIFEGCPHCGLRWDDYCSISEPIPSYQTIEKDMSTYEYSEYLNCLHDVLFIAVRPFDLITHQHKFFPTKINNILFNFQQAYDFLASPDFFEQWQHRRIGKLIELGNLKTLSNSQMLQLTQWNIAPRLHLKESGINDLTFHEQDLFLPKRLFNSSVMPVDFRLMVNVDKASTLLNLKIPTIQHLLAIDGMINNKCVDKYQGKFISLMDLDTFISQLKNKIIDITDDKQRPSLISFKKASKCLKYFNCDERQLVEFIILGELSIFAEKDIQDFTMNSIYLNENDLSQRLNDYFLTSFTGTISNSRVREMCGLNQKQFRELKDAFHLNVIKYQKNFSCIDAKELEVLFKEKIILNRWSKINNVNYLDVKEYVKHQKTTLHYSGLDYLNVTLYPNTEEMHLILERYLDYLNGEHHKLAQICK